MASVLLLFATAYFIITFAQPHQPWQKKEIIIIIVSSTVQLRSTFPLSTTNAKNILNTKNVLKVFPKSCDSSPVFLVILLSTLSKAVLSFCKEELWSTLLISVLVQTLVLASCYHSETARLKRLSW